jgi:hypothetical protein
MKAVELSSRYSWDWIINLSDRHSAFRMGIGSDSSRSDWIDIIVDVSYPLPSAAEGVSADNDKSKDLNSYHRKR